MTRAEKARVAARLAAGLSVEAAARRARICPAYLRRVERHGRAPWILANRLSKLLNCSPRLFL